MRRIVSAFMLCVVCASGLRAQSMSKFFKFYELGMGAEYFHIVPDTSSSGDPETGRAVFNYQFDVNLPLFHPDKFWAVDMSPGIGLMIGHPAIVTTSSDDLKSKLPFHVNIPLFLTVRYGTDASYYENLPWGFAVGGGLSVRRSRIGGSLRWAGDTGGD